MKEEAYLWWFISGCVGEVASSHCTKDPYTSGLLFLIIVEL